MLLCICISFESEDMHTYACAYSSIEPLAWDLGHLCQHCMSVSLSVPVCHMMMMYV